VAVTAIHRVSDEGPTSSIARPLRIGQPPRQRRKATPTDKFQQSSRETAKTTEKESSVRPFKTGRGVYEIMPVLDNPRYETFVQALASGKNKTEAYEIAGYKSNDGNASTLAAKPEIQARLKEIKGASAAKVELTREWVLGKLIENHDRAVAAEEGAIANRSLELLGKEIGMFIDRKEVRTGKLDAIDDDQLAALIAAAESVIAAGPAIETQGRADEAPAGKPH
jgi:hypothetical protein